MSARRALILAHETDDTSALVGERLRERGFELTDHLVTADNEQPNRAVPFPDAADYDLIVPMGSVRSLTNKAEISSWIYDEIDLIRNAHDGGTPIFGVCFGGQLLAEALGGSVEVGPITEIGWFEIEGHHNPVGPGPWFEWHHDRFHVPDSATALAHNDAGVQLFRAGQSIGTQFHPEVTVAHVCGFLDGTIRAYLERNRVIADQLLADTEVHAEANAKQCRELVDWFLDEVSGF